MKLLTSERVCESHLRIPFVQCLASVFTSHFSCWWCDEQAEVAEDAALAGPKMDEVGLGFTHRNVEAAAGAAGVSDT